MPDGSVKLMRFGEQQLPLALPWFDDPDTQRWLGDRSWLIRGMRRQPAQVGTVFRGALQIASHAWLAYDDNGSAVGYIDCGVYDRWTTYGGEDPNGPIILAAIDRPSCALTLVVAPAHRRRGRGTAMLKALIAQADLSYVDIFGGGVDPANIASMKCLEAAGFICPDDRPDFEGMLYYLFMRSRR